MIKGLPASARGVDFIDFFACVADVMTFKIISRQAELFVGVLFRTAAFAKAAIQAFDGCVLHDKQIRLRTFIYKKKRIHRKLGDDEPDNYWTNLYVKNFPESWDEHKLHKVFSSYGGIACSKVVRSLKDRSKQFGFVDCIDQESAISCMENLNGAVIQEGHECLVLHVSKAEDAKQQFEDIEKAARDLGAPSISKYLSRTVQITNIHTAVLEEDIQILFSRYGAIVAVQLWPRHGDRSFAFVMFTSVKSAENACSKLNNVIIYGRRISVSIHKSAAQRAAERGHSAYRIFAKRGNAAARHAMKGSHHTRNSYSNNGKNNYGGRNAYAVGSQSPYPKTNTNYGAGSSYSGVANFNSARNAHVNVQQPYCAVPALPTAGRNSLSCNIPMSRHPAYQVDGRSINRPVAISAGRQPFGGGNCSFVQNPVHQHPTGNFQSRDSRLYANGLPSNGGVLQSNVIPNVMPSAMAPGGRLGRFNVPQAAPSLMNPNTNTNTNTNPHQRNLRQQTNRSNLIGGPPFSFTQII